MTLTPNNYGNNPFQPGVVQDAFIPDQLIAGDMKVVTKPATITGAAAYKRGTVMGKVTLGTASSAAKSGGNTGNGTFVLDATTPVLANAEAGIYTARFTSTTNIRLESTTGVVLADIAIVATTGQTATISERVKGVVTQGSVTFAVGDGFDITVAAGTGAYKIATAAATDGSQNPVTILVDDADATSADVLGGVYQMGEFNGNAVTLGAGITLAAATAALELQNIYLKTPLTAADPT